MSSRAVHPPVSRPFPRLYLLVGLILFAAGLAASLGAGWSARVVVDGTPRRYGFGTTVGDVISAGHLKASDGDVVSAGSGRVVVVGGGTPLLVWRNGNPATADRVLYDGDEITSTSGRDVVERVATRREPIPYTTRHVGTGPLVAIESPGTDGVRQFTQGVVSGEEITSTVLEKPTPMIVKHYRRSASDKVVALTFDDGPWPGQTDKILRVLRQYKVRGTFFMIGYLTRRYPALARTVSAEGHLVGNHTAGHSTLTRLTASAIDDQIRRGGSIIAASVGETPRWFRPPGGNLSPAVIARMRRANLKIALWTVDPQDWRLPGAKRIAHEVASKARPGSIILLHDGGGDRTQTIQALPAIIRSLQSRGYRFVTLDEL